jgi:hypothetical protein
MPLLVVCIVILLQPSLKKRIPHGIRKYLSYLFLAPTIMPLENQNNTQFTPEETRTNLKNQLLMRLGFIYLFVSIFIISNIIAQFYLVVDDLLQPVTQGGTDLVRTWVSITIYGPFVGGWKGSLPWYGSFVLPPLNGSTFHETWRWISFTQAVSSNSSVFDSSFSFLLITTVLTSTMFFVPLVLKSIRQSLVPSLFFYSTAVLIMTKSVFACLGQSLRLIFGETITYGLITINSTTGQLLPNLQLALLVCSIFIIVMFFVAIALGRKLWRIHYPDDEKSMKWFIYTVSIMYWLSLVFNVVIV